LLPEQNSIRLDLPRFFGQPLVMPWYYAGSEAKPVGPVTLDELHAKRVSGVISPETYIIEQTGQPDPSWTWKRYREIFPTSPSLPPIPTIPASPEAQAQPTAATSAPVNPLFPSAAAGPATPSPFPAAQLQRPDPYYATKETNSSCSWGFGLGLASPFLLPFCGLGVLLAFASIFLSIRGMLQLRHHREQSGHGLAIAGFLFSGLTLIVTLLALALLVPNAVTFHEQTTTEQTSNDSE
jgi:hypothetical protein